jgi:hypothetical protein
MLATIQFGIFQPPAYLVEIDNIKITITPTRNS